MSHESHTATSTSPQPEADVRLRIESAARNLFATKGYTATSLRSVAETAGVTKPMIYYYFGSKEGLYRTLLDSAYEDFRARLYAAATAAGDARTRLIHIAKVHMDGAYERVDVLRFLMAHAFGPQQGAPAFEIKHFYDAHASAVRRAFDAAPQDAKLPPADLEVFIAVFWGAMGVFCEHALGARDTAPEQTATHLPEKIVDMLWNGARQTADSPNKE